MPMALIGAGYQGPACQSTYDRALLNRALLIGDIHTETDLLATALKRARDVDKVLSVGDIVDGPHDPLACIAMLRAHDADVVSGNHERWVNQGHPFEPFDYPDDALAWLAALPSTREYETPRGRLLLCHGIGTNDMMRLEPDTDGYALENLDHLWNLINQGRFRFVAGGHTHVPMVRTIQGLTVLNPGTLVATQNPGYMIVDFAAGVVERWLLPSATQMQAFPLAP